MSTPDGSFEEIQFSVQQLHDEISEIRGNLWDSPQKLQEAVARARQTATKLSRLLASTPAFNFDLYKSLESETARALEAAERLHTSDGYDFEHKVKTLDVEFYELQSATLELANNVSQVTQDTNLSLSETLESPFMVFDKTRTWSPTLPSGIHAISETSDTDFHVSVYVAGDASQAVEIAKQIVSSLVDFFASEDLELRLAEGPVISSWWGKFRLSIKHPDTAKAISERIVKLEHAVEVAHLRIPMAQENQINSIAAANILSVIQGSPSDVMITLGSMFIVKSEGRILIKTLSPSQRVSFEQNTHLQNSPLAAYEFLIAIREEADETGPSELGGAPT